MLLDVVVRRHADLVRAALPVAAHVGVAVRRSRDRAGGAARRPHARHIAFVLRRNPRLQLKDHARRDERDEQEPAIRFVIGSLAPVKTTSRAICSVLDSVDPGRSQVKRFENL